jgi:hypothetical protein
MRSRMIPALTLVMAVTLVAPSPASAVGGLEVKIEHSNWDSAAEKSATASCDAGTVVLGGGGFIAGGGRSVHLTRLQPLGNTDDFTVTATERGAYASNWQVQAYAICGNAPAGLEYIGGPAGTSSDSVKGHSDSCSGSKQLISLGARVLNGGGQVYLDDMAVDSDINTTYVTAYEDEDGYSGDWNLYSFGVCANPLPGLELRSATTVADSTDDAIGVSCTGTKKVHGLGGMMNGATGEAFYAGLYPSEDLTLSGAVTREDSTGLAANWTTQIFAICAN